jgi:hypothetical protein
LDNLTLCGTAVPQRTRIAALIGLRCIVLADHPQSEGEPAAGRRGHGGERAMASGYERLTAPPSDGQQRDGDSQSEQQSHDEGRGHPGSARRFSQRIATWLFVHPGILPRAHGNTAGHQSWTAFLGSVPGSCAGRRQLDSSLMARSASAEEQRQAKR